MEAPKKQAVSFDPNNPAWRRKLWVRLNTPDGDRTFIMWARIGKLLAVLTLAGWLGLATTAWIFVRYKRGMTEASFVDIAFLPLRYQHYRQMQGSHYFKVAEAQLQSGQWSQAVGNLRVVIARDPQNLKARRLLAEIYHQLQRGDLALQVIEGGIAGGKNDPDYIQHYLSLLLGSGDMNRVSTVCDQLLLDVPASSPARSAIVERAVQAAIAARHYDRATKIVAESGFQNTLKGDLLFSNIESASGYSDLAILRLEGWWQQSPGNEAISIPLTKLYTTQGRLQDALRVVSQRVMKRPDSPGALVDLIVLQHSNGNSASFEREYTNFLTRFFADPRALNLLAVSSFKFQRPDLVRRVRDSAPRDEAGLPPIFLQLAVLQADCLAGDFANALQTATVIDTYANLPATVREKVDLNRIWAYYGMNTASEGDSRLSFFLAENHPRALADTLQLAMQLEQLKWPGPARRIYQTLTESNPSNPLPFIALIRFDLQQQSWAEINQNLPRLLNLDPMPIELLRQIWEQGQDALKVTPDTQQRIVNLLK